MGSTYRNWSSHIHIDGEYTRAVRTMGQSCVDRGTLIEMAIKNLASLIQ